ncbi:hypothetical protein OBBRIDRAFT_252867 [Obba rivulosa]|uniref:Uncharacterized protein n=1 Tax=Obba rivulosa TaxID=1052685 RepID=A0A8E2DQI6_9APHY|nr:hypothetical protein OBBRIDRAFT_252867 [Obba rivulosa]
MRRQGPTAGLRRAPVASAAGHLLTEAVPRRLHRACTAPPSAGRCEILGRGSHTRARYPLLPLLLAIAYEHLRISPLYQQRGHRRSTVSRWRHIRDAVLHRWTRTEQNPQLPIPIVVSPLAPWDCHQRLALDQRCSLCSPCGEAILVLRA